MNPRLLSAQYIAGYRLRLTFEDGTEGEIDLESQLWGEVFEALREVEIFKQFRVDRELDTIVWPTGADLAPEFLYRECA